MADKNDLLLLFDRPTEPVFMGKTLDAGITTRSFEVPTNYLPKEYQSIGVQLASRWSGDDKIQVTNIALPDLSIPMQLGRRENFALFIPRHRAIASKLIDIFMGMRNVADLTSVAVYARDRLNPYLFNYALSVALLHREDTKGIELPNFMQSFPGKFVDSAIFSRAREAVSVVPDEVRTPIIIPREYTASDLDPEHRVAYFREDIGINLHHWHWHLVYPFAASDRSIVAKDRRGELFYYMHQQVVSRYNFERLSNKLPKVVRFNNLRQPIPEGYFPKMDLLVASRAWPPRFGNASLSDVNRPVDQIRLDIAEVELWITRFRSAVGLGYVTNDQGVQTRLDEVTGIDILGNIMEASSLTPNRNYYGDLHNMGHVLVALCHDPDSRYLETFSVMGDSATAMRDPFFYRWHAFIDDLFQSFKGILPRYSTLRLNFPKITVTGLQVDVQGGQTNRLRTFWDTSDVDLSRGLDFSPRGTVLARFTHLQHLPFTYKIQVNNASPQQQMGTVRIFMAPKYDERGIDLLFNDQRLMFIELDKFIVTLKRGKNTISRKASDSSVTIPYERTFRSMQQRPESGADLDKFNFCGCGWPDHMLIPKGTFEGMQAELFVMISNYEQDRVVQTVTGTCNDASSYCGLQDKKYPDKQSMGFPFDRLARDGVSTLSEFLTPNMRTQNVTIQFSEARP